MKCLLKFFFETFKAHFQRRAFFQNLKGTLHFHGKLFFDEKMDFKWVNVREYREVYVCVWKREQGDILWTKLVQKAVDFDIWHLRWAFGFRIFLILSIKDLKSSGGNVLNKTQIPEVAFEERRGTSYH